MGAWSAWAAEHPDLMQVSLATDAGCGFIRGGVVPSDGDEPFTKFCNEVLDQQLPDDLVTLQPDVVMMMVTSRDIVPRQWTDEEGVLDPRDDRFVARLRTDYRTITELILSTTSARIVWIRAPATDPYWMGAPNPFTDPELLRIRENIVRDTVARVLRSIAGVGSARLDGVDRPGSRSRRPPRRPALHHRRGA